MTDTSKEAVERLADAVSAYHQADLDGVVVLVSRQACDEAAATLRQLLTERDAEKARADKAEWKFVALAFAVENGRRGTFQDEATEETVDKALDLHKQLTAANEKLASARKVIERQANDDGLWFLSRTAPEAYLQAALRNLHAAVEGTDALGNATHPTTPAGHEGQRERELRLISFAQGMSAPCRFYPDPVRVLDAFNTQEPKP